MRHRKSTVKLNRTSSHRKAMLNNLVASLFEKNVVVTTTAKAKEARKLAEKYITIAKKGNEDINARRLIAKDLHSKVIIKKLFSEIAPLYKDRKGGYTRVICVGNRKGDGGSVSILELVEKPAVKKEK